VKTLLGWRVSFSTIKFMKEEKKAGKLDFIVFLIF